MGDRLGIPGAVGFLPPLSFSPPGEGVRWGSANARRRPGLPPRGPRAPLLSASKEPDDLVSVWGCPQAPAPPATLVPSSHATARALPRAHTHTDTPPTHTHTHTHPAAAAETSQEPETTGKGDGEGGREKQQEDHTGFPTHGLHTLGPPFWVSPRTPVGPPTPLPNDTLTHTLSHTHPLAFARGLGLALGSQAEGDLGDLGCQDVLGTPRGSASPRAPRPAAARAQG